MSSTPAPGAGEELSTEVVVVRHGETAWNASRIVQGQMDPELNEAGRQQAVVVARRLSREAKPAAVYSSDLKPAAETAEIIARACGVSNGGGESLNQLNERCVSCLNKIAQEHIGERVVVVSHGAAILELCRHTDPPNSFIRRHIPNTSLNVFRVSGVTAQWTLERCGDVSHLKGNGFLEDSFGGDGSSA
ncbi:unnamed protein product [Miscanthus lutarioriparius]|uniref:Phosphoglycerate mutase-like protein 4 n=1 Tax=Miscanthus lutarioriparius TaxID=422564 RepID=A0A811QNI4_9POAL|nr:unnamed protein product [Miscanthus lutarioriparius]